MTDRRPRPERRQLIAELERQLAYYDRRHLVKPGLAGWAQARCGYSGCEEGTGWKLCHDLFYLKHRSVYFDMLILMENIRVSLRSGVQFGVARSAGQAHGQRRRRRPRQPRPGGDRRGGPRRRRRGAGGARRADRPRDQQRRRVQGAAARDRAGGGAGRERAGAGRRLRADRHARSKGEYKVKDATMRELHAEVKRALARLRAAGRSATSAASTTPTPTACVNEALDMPRLRRAPSRSTPKSPSATSTSKSPTSNAPLKFYRDVLGFQVHPRATARMPPSISAGGYHHHIGLNTWNKKARLSARLLGTHRPLPPRHPLPHPRPPSPTPSAASSAPLCPSPASGRPRRQRSTLPQTTPTATASNSTGTAPATSGPATPYGGGSRDGHANRLTSTTFSPNWTASEARLVPAPTRL